MQNQKFEITQWCTNPGQQAARATEFSTVTVNVCGCSDWNLLHNIILKWLLENIRVHESHYS